MANVWGEVVFEPYTAIKLNTVMKEGEWWGAGGGGIEPELYLRFESLWCISPGTSVIFILEKSQRTTLRSFFLFKTGYSVCLVMFLVWKHFSLSLRQWGLKVSSPGLGSLAKNGSLLRPEINKIFIHKPILSALKNMSEFSFKYIPRCRVLFLSRLSLHKIVCQSFFRCQNRK